MLGLARTLKILKEIKGMPQSKFKIGEAVFINGRCPDCIEATRHRPRTIVDIEYSPYLQANIYELGSNHHKPEDEAQRRWQFTDAEFRSYELEPISMMPIRGRPRQKRSYHYHRHYTYNGKPIKLDTKSMDKSLNSTVLTFVNGKAYRVPVFLVGDDRKVRDFIMRNKK